MATGKAKRLRDEPEVEDQPATKRQATAEGPLLGLQQVGSAMPEDHCNVVGTCKGNCAWSEYSCIDGPNA